MSEQNKISLIALDLDGTTLDSRGKLPQETKEALRRATAAGVHVVIATGRPFSALPAEVLGVEGIEYAITSNGACITHLAANEVLYTSNLDPSAIDILAPILKSKPFMVEIFTKGKSYVEKSIHDNIESYGLSEKHTRYVKETRIPQENIFDFMLEHRTEIENININFPDQEARAATRAEMEALGVATVTTSFDHNIELGGLTTSKANALRALCGILSVKQSEVMACGDSPNDIEMLRFAGLPVAVGNAKPEVKEAASRIVGTNDEFGVAEAVYKYVLYIS